MTGPARDYIVVKSYEPARNRKWHGAQHDSEYRQIGTEEGIGVPMGALPLDPEEVAHVRALPHIQAVVPDLPISIPEPIDSYADLHTKSADDAFRFHTLLEEREKGVLGKGAVVAVLDTGLDQTHSRNQFNLKDIKDFTTSGSPYDRQGHGTWCAGAVCGKEYGFAPEAELLVGKVLDDSGSGMYSWIIAGVNWAVAQGAKVASMSLGGPGEKESPLNLAINAAYLKGMNTAVAAGNEQRGRIDYVADASTPASSRYATTVAACNIQGEIAPFSNWGYCVDVMALGVNAEGLGLNGNFGRKMSGTSMATPFVAGALALARSLGRSAAQAKKVLYEETQNSRQYSSVKEGHGIMKVGGSA